MISPDDRLFNRHDQMPESEQEQQRLRILGELGLLETESVPIFEEATQTAAHFLDAPICVLGLLDRDRLWFKSAVGLSRIGLMNDLASSRQLPRRDSFCTHVIDGQHVLAIADTTTHLMFVDSLLVQRYGIRAYLGVPLMTSKGYCVGMLAVMALAPRDFTSKDIETLQLIARWSISEFEHDRLLKHPTLDGLTQPATSVNHSSFAQSQATAPSVKTNLMSQMTQELCTPLTSILGMASVLGQGIYGSLTEKQKEYIDIIRNSGQYLLSLVNEVVELGLLDDGNHCLNLSPVDIEMLCQQAISSLKQAAQRRDQQVQLTIEPGSRIWLLDKDKVRQMLYHLVFSVIQSSSTDSIIRVHISRRQNGLNLTIWTSHPWLGEGLPQVEFTSSPALAQFSTVTTQSGWGDRASNWLNDSNDSNDSAPNNTLHPATELFTPDDSRQSLGLLLSRQLAEMHGGNITVQGSTEEGLRYVIKLPQIQEGESVQEG
ncbi:MAG: GAF domain-containing sensor histidine kinase [Cyanobacteria bacterium CRU_2_1]|nr:GAF domain-containing sensor histidine kinase [Cyanobacteria bacterium RU_5_0]NJR57368.1 GAF domain-containing sensor histidine kinase [Cyanobacteria bacterium CRU_2_1]